MDQDLEDGEVVSDSEEYVPLERPANFSAGNAKTAPEVVYTDSETESSNDSNSDSDSCPQPKKPKIKLKPLRKLTGRPRKYDIWCSKAQEDVLAETLNYCDVSKKDRSRNVESYDYPSRYNKERGTTKRSRAGDNGDIRSRLGNREMKEGNGNPRLLLDLTVTEENTIEEIALDLSNKLYEDKEELILKVTQALGKQKCFELFKETKRIEKNGGILILNQRRRRTPGGVFLFLIRRDYTVSEEQKDFIFAEEKEKYKQELKEQKKLKRQEFKQKIAESRAELLPEILNRAEIYCKSNVKTEIDDVINPPPTPETDGHENSGDGMEGSANNMDLALEKCREKLLSYDDDYLDLSCSNNDMEMF